MVKHMRYSYEATMNMPIWERRIYLDLWQKELEEQKAEHERVKSKGKGR
jgi:hypothetical protein